MANSNLLAYAEFLRREATRTQTLLDIAAFMENAGSLEQAANDRERLFSEARAKHEQAKKDLDETQRQVELAKTNLQNAHEQSAALVNAAEAQAKSILSVAEKAKNEVLVKARADADAIRKEAHDAVRPIKDKAQAEVEQAKAAKAKVDAELREAQDKVAAERKVLANIEGRISKAKAAAASILKE